MKICVFAASCDVGEQYSRAVRALGRRLGAQGHALVFGGYGGGLMADIADGFADAGAEIIGVVPEFLEARTENHPGLTRIIRTKTLSERKDEMIARADVFVAAPGGIGTLDELFSILAMKATGVLDKEVVFFNVDGFFDGLLQCLREMEAKGFLYSSLDALYRVETPESLGLEL